MKIISGDRLIPIMLFALFSINSRSLHMSTRNKITAALFLLPPLLYTCGTIKKSSWLKKCAIPCLMVAGASSYQFLKTKKKSNDLLSKIIEEEYDAYFKKKSKVENFKLHFGGESNKEESLEELRSILTPLSDFFSKNNQRSPQDLHTFCGICTNRLGLEYLLLNILKKIGYTNINKVYIVDILYENSGTEFKQVIDTFQESVKGLFSTGSVTALTNCKQLRENNLKNTFFFYRHSEGNETEINHYIAQLMNDKNSIAVYISGDMCVFPSIHCEKEDLKLFNYLFEEQITENANQDGSMLNDFNELFINFFCDRKDFLCNIPRKYTQLKKIILLLKTFEKFTNQLDHNRSQIKNDIKIFVKNGNQWIKKAFKTIEDNTKQQKIILDLSINSNAIEKEAFEWCKKNIKKIHEELIQFLNNRS